MITITKMMANRIVITTGSIVKETTVVKYTSESGLPDWEGDIVGELTSSSIPNKSDIAEVVIGSHVTSIGSYALNFCSTMTNLLVGGEVTNIKSRAFWGCTGLTSVTIPNSVTSIGNWAFRGCNNITVFEFEGNAPTVGNEAFTGVASRCKAVISPTATGFSSPGEKWNGLIVEVKQ